MAELDKSLLGNMENDIDPALGSAGLANGAGDALDASEAAIESSFIVEILREIFYSPMNLALLAIICFLVYKIVRDRTEVPTVGALKTIESELPKLRRDFTVAELRHYDGNQPDGRVLVGVNGNVYDVTKGKRFYGPGGPYASFAGRDASRNLATFSVVPNDKDEFDDLSDLSAMEMDSVREWEMQFKEKYEHVGKLLRKGEQPTNYDDDEEDDTNANNVEDAAPVSATGGDTTSDGLRKRQAAAAAAAAEKATTNITATATATAGEDSKTTKEKEESLPTGSHITLDTVSRTNVAADGESSNSTDC